MSAVPVHKPIIVTRPKPQLRIEQGVKPSAASKVLVNSFVFGVVTLSVFFSSSLAGQVMVEKARRDGMRATNRAKAATKEESILRDKVQSLTRASAVDAWALANGFVAPDSLSAEVQQPDNAQAVH